MWILALYKNYLIIIIIISSNHFKNGTKKLNVYFSLLLTAMLTHNYVYCSMLESTIIPIPQNRRKSLNCSDNYRAIALSSILGKLLDWVILLYCDKFSIWL